MKNIIGIVASFTSVIVIIIGAYVYIENRYALKNQLQQIENSLNSKALRIEKKLEIKILSDDISQIQDRIWVLQDRIDRNPDDLTAKEQHRELNTKKLDLMNKLKTLRESILK